MSNGGWGVYRTIRDYDKAISRHFPIMHSDLISPQKQFRNKATIVNATPDPLFMILEKMKRVCVLRVLFRDSAHWIH
jgi:hypothetical protein